MASPTSGRGTDTNPYRHVPATALWTEGKPIDAAFRSKITLPANRKLAAFCAQRGIPYVDTWRETATGDGYMKPGYDLDGVHLKRSAVEPSLNACIGALLATAP